MFNSLLSPHINISFLVKLCKSCSLQAYIFPRFLSSKQNCTTQLSLHPWVIYIPAGLSVLYPEHDLTSVFAKHRFRLRGTANEFSYPSCFYTDTHSIVCVYAERSGSWFILRRCFVMNYQAPGPRISHLKSSRLRFYFRISKTYS